MEDSGSRVTFEGGGQREDPKSKCRLDLISPFAEQRLGEWLRQGADKYGDRNWEQGIPFSYCIASIRRHLNKFQQGSSEEDHLAAVMCNAMFLMHFRAMMQRRAMSTDFDDRPKYHSLPPKPPNSHIGKIFRIPEATWRAGQKAIDEYTREFIEQGVGAGVRPETPKDCDSGRGSR